MTYDPLDVVWILLCTVLVIVMQPGFVFFETGLTRSKNSISVAIKNLADFCVVGIIFGLIGFGLMFGNSLNGLGNRSRGRMRAAGSICYKCARKHLISY